MPVHPSEEEAPEGIYEKVAKNPSSTSESTASEHESHHNEHAPAADAKASAQDFQSKGPQIPMSMDGMTPSTGFYSHISQSVTFCSNDRLIYVDMPPKASKEELRARAEELNKE